MKSKPISINTLRTITNSRTLRICWATSTCVTLTNLALLVIGRLHSLVLYTSIRVDARLEKRTLLQPGHYFLASFYMLYYFTLGLVVIEAWHFDKNVSKRILQNRITKKQDCRTILPPRVSVYQETSCFWRII